MFAESGGAVDVLRSLLCSWPSPPTKSSPSILLWGPSGSGKSHCVGDAIASINPEEQVVLRVQPALARSITVRERDGSSGLRSTLRSATRQACAEHDALTDRTARHLSRSLAIVLDHLQFFATISSQCGSAEDAADDNLDNCPPPPHPEWLTDLVGILRASPPLWAPDEIAAMGITRVVFVGLFSGHVDQLDPILRSHGFDLFVMLPTPTEAERRRFFTKASVSTWPSTATIAAMSEALSLRTGGITYRGLVEVNKIAETLLLNVNDKCTSSEYADPTPNKKEVANAFAQRTLKSFRASPSMAAEEHRQSAGFVDVQITRWADIAGLEDIKNTLRQLVTRPVRFRSSYAHFGLRPSTGVLLYGPPGTGKTMLAKAMATELHASFISIDLPVLLQAEVGESERRLRQFFDVARERSPSVIFLDEVQAAFGHRHHQGSASGHVSSHDSRLVSHLLQLLDEAQADENHLVVFVAATNVVEHLDPLILRAGRLDTLIEVPLPDAPAREALARHVVCGEWASWFATEDLMTNPTPLTVLQDSLVRCFVDGSKACSGADLRRATAVFAAQITRRLGAEMTFVDEVQEGRRITLAKRMCSLLLSTEAQTETLNAGEAVLSPLALELMSAALRQSSST